MLSDEIILNYLPEKNPVANQKDVDAFKRFMIDSMKNIPTIPAVNVGKCIMRGIIYATIWEVVMFVIIYFVIQHSSLK